MQQVSLVGPEASFVNGKEKQLLLVDTGENAGLSGSQQSH